MKKFIPIEVICKGGKATVYEDYIMLDADKSKVILKIGFTNWGKINRGVNKAKRLIKG